MDSFFYPIVLFDRTMQKLVDMVSFQIMRATGCGKSKIRFFINVAALFSGIGLGLSLYRVVHRGTGLIGLILIVVACMRIFTLHLDYRADRKAEYVGARSIVDLRLMSAGWQPRAWFWFVLLFQFYFESRTTEFKGAFFVFYDSYLVTWILSSHFAYTPPTPPPTKLVAPARLAVNTSS